MTTPTELRPCPFCAGNASLSPGRLHAVHGCGVQDCAGNVRWVPDKTWNTRPIEDALQARVKELEDSLRNFLAWSHGDMTIPMYAIEAARKLLKGSHE